MPRPVHNPNLAQACQALEQLGATDLTALVARGTLGQSHGRDRELASVLASLAERRSVILLGPPDVGKTALIHEVARRIVSGRVPTGLLGAKIFQISTQRIVAGSQNTGMWAGQLQRIVDALIRGRTILLYVDDIWNLPHIGSYSGHSSSLMTFLLPHLERKEVILLGESTPERYDQSGAQSSGSDPGERTPALADDPSLLRQIDLVTLAEADHPVTRTILQAAAADLERTEGVRFEAGVPDRAIELARRFVHDRAFPGKAIRLLQDAVAAHRRAGAEATASANPTGTAGAAPGPDGRPPIDAGHLVETFRAAAGLPVAIVSDDVPLRAHEIRAYFGERIVGQSEAVEAIVRLILLVKAELQDPSRPLGVFLFVGPTGSGKTYLAKTLAEYLFGSADRLIRLDMSEFQHPDSLRLLQTRLVERTRQASFSVLLLDEVEKAHPLAYDLFLQAFDDARLSDSRGQVASLRNTIVVMTSNLGARDAANRPRGGFGFLTDAPIVADAGRPFREAVEAYFRPELINRLDRIVVFDQLGRDEMRTIARRELGAALLRDGVIRRDVQVAPIGDDVVDLLVTAGFDATYGARPLQRVIKDLVLAPIAAEIASRPRSADFLLDLQVEKGEIVVGLFPSPKLRLKQAAAPQGPRLPRPPSGAALGLAGEAERVASRLRDLRTSAHVTALDEHRHQLAARMGAISFWDNPADAASVIAALRHLERVLADLSDLADQTERLAEVVAGLVRGGRPDTARIESLRREVERLEDRALLVELETLATDAESAGTGGALVVVAPIERGARRDGAAQAWAEQVRNLYAAWAERRGCDAECVTGPDGHSPAVQIQGAGVARMLAGEVGVHRREGDPAAPEDDFRRVASPRLAWVTVQPLGPSAPADESASGATPAADDRADSATGRGQVVRLYRIERERTVRDPRTGAASSQPRDVLAGEIDPFLVAYLRGDRLSSEAADAVETDGSSENSAPVTDGSAATGSAGAVGADSTPAVVRLHGDDPGAALQATVAAAPAGETIVLPPGMIALSRPLTIGRALTLVGAGALETELVAESGGVTIDVIAGAAVTLRDLGVRWAGSGAAADVVCVADSEITIERCRIAGATTDDRAVGGGVALGGRSSGRISNTEIVGEGIGVLLQGDASTTIADCKITGHPGGGIVLAGQATAEIVQGDFRENKVALLVQESAKVSVVWGTFWYSTTGILVEGDAHATVKHAVCDHNKENGIVVMGRATVELANNRCEGNGYNGIMAADDATGSVSGNQCIENETNGILVRDRARLTVEGNVCRKNHVDGIALHDSASATVRQNICEQNKDNGVYVASGCVATMEQNHAVNNQGGDYGGHVRTGATSAVGGPDDDPDEPEEEPDDD